VYVQGTTGDGHVGLSGRTLTETAPDGTRKEREPAGGDKVLRVLADDFGIRLPDGTRLPA
jgi:N-hydroxyarylamine O-acetyltransferase